MHVTSNIELKMPFFFRDSEKLWRGAVRVLITRIVGCRFRKVCTVRCEVMLAVELIANRNIPQCDCC
jgi:hypothetical protein